MKGMEVIRKLRIDFRDFPSIYSACLGRVFLIQSRMEKNYLKQKEFKLNFKDANIILDEVVYDIQYMGCEAQDNIWIWGWDEPNKPEGNVFDFTEQIKDFGEVYFADYAKVGKFKMLKENFGRDLASTICALYNYCSHSVKTPNGILYLALTNAPKSIFEDVDLKSFIEVTNHCAKNIKMNHKLFVEGFLSFFDIEYFFDGDILKTNIERNIEIKFALVDNEYKMLELKVEGKESL